MLPVFILREAWIHAQKEIIIECMLQRNALFCHVIVLGVDCQFGHYPVPPKMLIPQTAGLMDNNIKNVGNGTKFWRCHQEPGTQKWIDRFAHLQERCPLKAAQIVSIRCCCLIIYFGGLHVPMISL
jgi:hypothetical protein